MNKITYVMIFITCMSCFTLVFFSGCSRKEVYETVHKVLHLHQNTQQDDKIRTDEPTNKEMVEDIIEDVFDIAEDIVQDQVEDIIPNF